MAAVVVGMVTLNSLWTTVLAIGLMIANLWHITKAWHRVAGDRLVDTLTSRAAFRRTHAGKDPT